MAFSIMVELKSDSLSWKDLNEELRKYYTEYVEFFPIPKEISTGKNYIGMVILNKMIPFDKLNEIKDAVIYLLKSGHQVVELYSSTVFTVDNVDLLSDKFFKGNIVR